MKTYALFYELFHRWPGVALQLTGLDPSRADAYEFRSEEIKQTAFRLDSILALRIVLCLSSIDHITIVKFLIFQSNHLR